jgi:hypothetical protein
VRKEFFRLLKELKEIRENGKRYETDVSVSTR